MMGMWNAVASSAETAKKSSKTAQHIAKDNEKVKGEVEQAKPQGVGIDVADWASDDVFFNRVFKKYAELSSKADGSSKGEKVINKDDGKSAINDILLQKIQKKDKQKRKETHQKQCESSCGKIIVKYLPQ